MHMGDNFLGLFNLIGKLAVPVNDFREWKGIVRVNGTQIGGIWVSTVFLGINHQYGDGLPILFETMIFRGGKGNECDRCESWEQAETQHEEAVAKVKAEIKDKVND